MDSIARGPFLGGDIIPPQSAGGALCLPTRPTVIFDRVLRMATSLKKGSATFRTFGHSSKVVSLGQTAVQVVGYWITGSPTAGRLETSLAKESSWSKLAQVTKAFRLLKRPADTRSDPERRRALDCPRQFSFFGRQAVGDYEIRHAR
jgi:hypothetical protein